MSYIPYKTVLIQAKENQKKILDYVINQLKAMKVKEINEDEKLKKLVEYIVEYAEKNKFSRDYIVNGHLWNGVEKTLFRQILS
jgi:cytochrome c1